MYHVNKEDNYQVSEYNLKLSTKLLSNSRRINFYGPVGTKRRALDEQAVTEFNKYKDLIAQAFEMLLGNAQRSWTVSQTDMTEARNVGTTMGHFIGLGSIAGWPVHIFGMIGFGFSSPMMPQPACPSASEAARVTAVANQDDDGLDELGQLEKRGAALAVRWYHHEDKQERILSELEEINEQIYFPHFAIWNPAKWVSDQDSAR